MNEEPGAEIKTIDDYIDRQSDRARTHLVQLRQVVRKAAPDAVEGISYKMPVFKFHGMLAYFAAFKNHYSLFIAPGVMHAFSDRLEGFSLTKSAIHFSFDLPVPEELVTEIIQYAIEFNLLREARKAAAKPKKNKR